MVYWKDIVNAVLMESSVGGKPLESGYKLHWYEIRGVIGRGGFGITYLAYDANLDREVAIKEFMPKDFATRETDSKVQPRTGEEGELFSWGLDKFIAEARTLARFTHPNIVRVLSVFSKNNTAYMVMDYVQGKDLAVTFDEGERLSESQLLDIFIPIMDGLILVHNVGFIHRDIKPANIYICSNGDPLLLDFGAARVTLPNEKQALTSLVTLGFTPFEQYNEGSGQQGPWTDIYSLAASIYVGITGNKPIDASSRGMCFLDKGIDPYQPASLIAKGKYSENFLLAVDKALLFKIEDRPANILEWADMLLGKTPAPPLPDYLVNKPDVDKDAVLPHIWNHSGTSSLGRQRLLATYESGSTHNDMSRPAQNRLDDLDSQRVKPLGIEKPSERPVTAQANIVSSVLDSAGDVVRNAALNIKGASSRAKIGFGMLAGFILILIVAVANMGQEAASSVSEVKPVPLTVDTTKEKVASLLVEADRSFSRGAYVAPDEGNAFSYYQKVLSLDPGNQQAKDGLASLSVKMLHLAQRAFYSQHYEKSQAYLVKLGKLGPYSVTAGKLESRLSEKFEMQFEADRLIKKARVQSQAGRLTKPAQSNALFYYRKLLAQQPGHPGALKGIDQLKEKALNLAYAASEKREFSGALAYLKAVDVIQSGLKEADDLRALIAKKKSAAKALARKQVKKRKAAARSAAIKKVTVAQAEKIVGDFINAFKARDKGTLSKLSHYQNGRSEFVGQLFSQYKNINMRISAFEYIARSNSARVEVELDELINNKGKFVKAGDWSKFEVFAKRDRRGVLKMHW